MRKPPGEEVGCPGSLALVAFSHRHSSVDVLELVSMDAERAERFGRAVLRSAGSSEVVVVSTCNRTEIYLAGPAPDVDVALDELGIVSGATREVLDAGVMISWDVQAVEHLLRVAAGLESRVMGEAEVVGQLRSAFAAAEASGCAGPMVGRLFRCATSVGRRALHTDEGTLTPSLPRLALDAARRDDTVVSGPTVILGSGVMAALTAEELVRRGLDFWVCARRPELAAELAGAHGRVVPFDALGDALTSAGAVICATGARSPLVRVADLEHVMHARGGRALTIVDLSLPRNIDPLVDRLPGVRLVGLEHLGAAGDDVRRRRRVAIVDDELDSYRSWAAGQVAGRFIAALHEHVHATCRAAVEESLGAEVADRAVLHAAARKTANKLLHNPSVMIKTLIATGDVVTALAVLSSYGVTECGRRVDEGLRLPA